MVALGAGDQLIVLSPDDVHRMINELTYIEQVIQKWRSEHE